MNRLDSQELECIIGERKAYYEIILWGASEIDGEVEENVLFESESTEFAVEVREIWTDFLTKQSSSRQVSRVELSSLGAAQNVYHYTAEVLLYL